MSILTEKNVSLGRPGSLGIRTLWSVIALVVAIVWQGGASALSGNDGTRPSGLGHGHERLVAQSDPNLIVLPARFGWSYEEAGGKLKVVGPTANETCVVEDPRAVEGLGAYETQQGIRVNFERREKSGRVAPLDMSLDEFCTRIAKRVSPTPARPVEAKPAPDTKGAAESAPPVSAGGSTPGSGETLVAPTAPAELPAKHEQPASSLSAAPPVATPAPPGLKLAREEHKSEPETKRRPSAPKAPAVRADALPTVEDRKPPKPPAPAAAPAGMSFGKICEQLLRQRGQLNGDWSEWSALDACVRRLRRRAGG